MTTYLPSLTRDNLSLYCVPLALAVNIAPHVFATGTYKKATGKSLDVRQPCGFTQQVTDDQGCDSKTKGRILRAEAAMTNGFETLGFFAGAVAAGNAAHLSPGLLNALSIGYLVSRVAYNHIYIFNDLLPGPVRSLAWMMGLACTTTLWIQAGRNINSSVLL